MTSSETSIAFGLALPDGVAATPTGPLWNSFEEWEAAGHTLLQSEKLIQWRIADWWIFGFQRYGERKAKALALRLGLKPQTLMNYGSVARSIEPSRRREGLSFSHHEAVAAQPAEQQERWLTASVENRWSVAQLRQHLATAGVVKPRTKQQEFQRYMALIRKDANINARLTAVPPRKYAGLYDYLIRENIPLDDLIEKIDLSIRERTGFVEFLRMVRVAQIAGGLMEAAE